MRGGLVAGKPGRLCGISQVFGVRRQAGHPHAVQVLQCPAVLQHCGALCDLGDHMWPGCCQGVAGFGTDNGYALPDGRDVDHLERIERKTPEPAPWGPTADELFSSGMFGPSTKRISPVEPVRDPSKVFVVHGRDMRPVETLKQYLLFLGLQMMPWSEAVGFTRASQPHIYDVVRAAMTNAAAVIVIFSPDDLARVKDDFSEPGDHDRTPQGQARQNVLLEAGMAFAMEPTRTIFLKSAATRDISDIAGFNWVKLDGKWDSRSDLKNRLTKAGAAVRQGSYDLGDPLAGAFKVTA